MPETLFNKIAGRQETAVGTALFENIAARNGKKHSQNTKKLKQITIQEHHNIHTYSLFSILYVDKSRKRF